MDGIKLFDSHAHYYDKKLNEIGGADRVLKEEVFNHGVEKIVNIGTNNENNLVCIAQASKYEGMYAAVGIHPEDCEMSEKSIDEEMETLEKIIGDQENRKNKKIVALGEIGLDYHLEQPSKELQKEYFKRQLELAQKLDLPVIIHDRDAHGDCFETVIKYPRVKGVFHSYSGSTDMALELIRRGWIVSFSGVVTFKNAPRVKKVVSNIPLESMMIETDCPYLAPHPYRGKVNHSGLMINTAKEIANLHNTTVEKVAKITYENAMKFYRIE